MRRARARLREEPAVHVGGRALVGRRIGGRAHRGGEQLGRRGLDVAQPPDHEVEPRLGLWGVVALRVVLETQAHVAVGRRVDPEHHIALGVAARGRDRRCAPSTSASTSGATRVRMRAAWPPSARQRSRAASIASLTTRHAPACRSGATGTTIGRTHANWPIVRRCSGSRRAWKGTPKATSSPAVACASTRAHAAHTTRSA